MPDADPPVKSRRDKFDDAVVRWIDCHPRTGWFIMTLLLLNTALNLLDLLNH